MKEEWKDIYFKDKGKLYDYRNQYQVSNTGKIKALDRKVFIKTSGYYRYVKGMELKLSIHRGYNVVYLYDRNNNCKCHLVHRIVAKMFLLNKEELPCVNHIDGNKLNNYVDNLEWCTYSYNLKHAYKNNLRVNTFKQLEKLHKDNEKTVYQYSLDGKLLNIFKDKKETEKMGFNRKYISRVCRGERKTYLGFIWKYCKI